VKEPCYRVVQNILESPHDPFKAVLTANHGRQSQIQLNRYSLGQLSTWYLGEFASPTVFGFDMLPATARDRCATETHAFVRSFVHFES
jgi:hypothetical protein